MTFKQAIASVSAMHDQLADCAATLAKHPTVIADQMEFDRVVATELPRLVAEVTSLVRAITEDQQ